MASDTVSLAHKPPPQALHYDGFAMLAQVIAARGFDGYFGFGPTIERQYCCSVFRPGSSTAVKAAGECFADTPLAALEAAFARALDRREAPQLRGNNGTRKQETGHRSGASPSAD